MPRSVQLNVGLVERPITNGEDGQLFQRKHYDAAFSLIRLFKLVFFGYVWSFLLFVIFFNCEFAKAIHATISIEWAPFDLRQDEDFLSRTLYGCRNDDLSCLPLVDDTR